VVPGAADPLRRTRISITRRTGGGDPARGAHIAQQSAGHVYGYAVGLDMTRRDLQMKARDMGRPWDFGKSFDESARSRISILSRVTATIRPETSGSRSTAKCASRRTGRHIWNVPDTIAFLSDITYQLAT